VWSTDQLVNFAAALSHCSSISAAAQQAMERAVEALDADAAALLRDGELMASLGGGAGLVSSPEGLVAMASGQQPVPGVDTIPVLSVPVEALPAGRLMLARAGSVFTLEETSLVRAIGRLLSVTITHLELVDELLAHKQLFEQLGFVQRALARRAPL